MRGLAAALAVVGSLATAGSAAAFDPVVEAKNFSKTQERAAIYTAPDAQLRLRQVGTRNELAALQAQLADPERAFFATLCARGEDGCAGEFRLYDWKGLVEPVLFTARKGATLSGHVWATRAGPAQRPGVVITNGSVQADEQMYWYAAQALAKAGYVVLTFDPQGQGQSDIPGEGADAQEGVPAQSDGRPFFDGTEDALELFFSTAAHPYVPLPSCETGTSHAAKQQRRAAAGLNAAYNPFAHLLDPDRVGVAGHSYGAAGVSYVGQWDPRVKAIVAWDDLGPAEPGSGNGELGEKPCPADPGARTPAALTKPALGMSADYGIVATPYTADPDPLAKSAQSLAYSRAGVDTGELIIRGGTHLDFSFIPNAAFGATLRGADMIAWYTTAWFDKYVKGDATADARLLTTLWRDDAAEAAVDPDGDGNMFSFYYRSRLDIDGFACEDLRAGCAGMAPDGRGDYSYLDLATAPDPGTG
jgi:dienelactone hydrolase